jgi:hypothetical protein
MTYNMAIIKHAKSSRGWIYVICVHKPRDIMKHYGKDKVRGIIATAL